MIGCQAWLAGRVETIGVMKVEPKLRKCGETDLPLTTDGPCCKVSETKKA